MSLFSLDGKVAVITGSSRGIGKAIAERMAEHGAKVVISSRKPEPCDEVAAAINAKHGAGTRDLDPGQHLVQGRAASTWSTRPRASSAGSTSWSATRRRTRTTARWPASRTTSSARSSRTT